MKDQDARGTEPVPAVAALLEVDPFDRDHPSGRSRPPFRAQGEKKVVFLSGSYPRLIASVVVAVIGIYSVTWQIYQRRCGASNRSCRGAAEEGPSRHRQTAR